MKNLILTSIISIAVTIVALKVFYCPDHLNCGHLTHTDSMNIARSYVAARRPIVKNPKLPKRVDVPPPHTGLHLTGLKTDKIKVVPGPTPGMTFEDDIDGVEVPIMQFTAERDNLMTSYTDTIALATEAAYAANYAQNLPTANDAAYFLVDAETIFNFIYSTNNNTNTVQDLVFTLGRNKGNNNLTLMISGVDMHGKPISINQNGTSTNFIEDAYPCPTCTYQ